MGPYFIEFARRAKKSANIPLMLTGGFKRRDQAIDAVSSGAVDIVGLARAMVLNPRLADKWLRADGGDPEFSHFESSVPGGITAWYTMRLTALGEGREGDFALDIPAVVCQYEKRVAERCVSWEEKFFRDLPRRDESK